MHNVSIVKDNKKNVFKPTIHQLLPGFATGDAISNYALELRGILRSQGYESEVFTSIKNVSLDGREYCKDYGNLKFDNSKDIVIFHFSIASEVTDFFKSLPVKKILIYHNITPAKYFENINREKYEFLLRGRDELKQLINYVDLAIGVSEYNRKELDDLGFKYTGVLNLILNERMLKAALNNDILKKYDDNYVNFISVGRLVPNKKPEDVIKVFYYYKKTINFNSRLFLIGSIEGMSNYVEYLRGLTALLSLTDVIFAGHVNDADLKTYYKISDLFITMSEHEGFCIPLLEAMFFELPIIAYDSSAVSEILSSSGVLVKTKDYTHIAELMSCILGNSELKNKIISGQKNRLGYFNLTNTANTLFEYLDQLSK